jgi:hypothetical protein
MGEKRNAFWWESQKEWDHWEDLDVGESIILKWILRDVIVWYRLDWSALG